jgi:hypothetical protein
MNVLSFIKNEPNPAEFWNVLQQRHTLFLYVYMATTWCNDGVFEGFKWRVCIVEVRHLK